MSVPDPTAYTPDNAGVPPAPASPPPAPSSTTTPPASAGSPGAGATFDLDAELPNQPVFDPGYVRDLRGQAINYRTQLREAQGKLNQYSVLDQYEADDRQVWLDLMNGWITDPTAVARAFQQIATSVLGDGADNGNGAPSMTDTPPPDAGAGELTAEQVQQLINDAMQAQQAQQAQQAAVAEVHNELRQAGLDPESADAMWVLHTAHRVTDGDLQAAIAKLRERDQAAYDQRIEAARTGRAPLAPSNGTVATSTPAPPSSFKEIGRAAQAFIDGQRTSQPGQA